MNRYIPVKPEMDDEKFTSKRENSYSELPIQDVGHLGSPSESASTLTASYEHGLGTSTGINVNKEKARDLSLVDFTINDPEVC